MLGHIRALIIPTLLIVVCSVLLWRDFADTRDSGDGKPIAITKLSVGDVKRKPLSRMLWFDAPTEQKLFRKDSVRTAAGARTIIELVNGNVIELTENSLIVLEEMRGGGYAIDFVSGNLVARGSGEGLTLKAKGVAIDAARAQVSLSSDPTQEGGTRLNVVGGEATVQTADGSKLEVKQDQSATLSARDVSEVKTLPLKLVAPENAILLSQKKARSTPLQWEVLRKIPGAQLQIARDAAFGDLLLDLKTPKLAPGVQRTRAPALKPGTYFWRVRSVEDGTLTEARMLEVHSDEPLRLVEPVPDRAFKYVKRVPRIFYEWQAPTHLDEFEIQFSRTKDFAGVFYSEKVQNPLSALGLGSVAVEKDFEGQVFWRIVGRTKAHREIESASPAWGLKFERANELAQVELLFPPPHTQLVYRGGLQVPMRWRQDPEAARYELQIASNADFSSDLQKIAVNSPPFTWKAPGTGPRFWRVTAYDWEGNASRPSKTSEFEVLPERELASVPEATPSPLPSELVGEPEPLVKPQPPVTASPSPLPPVAAAAEPEPSPLPVPKPPEPEPAPPPKAEAPKPEPPVPAPVPSAPARVAQAEPKPQPQASPPPPPAPKPALQLEAPQDLTPRGSVSYAKGEASLTLRWKAVPSATRYRIRVWSLGPVAARNPAQAAAPEPIVRETLVPQAAVAGLEPGAYRWEVEALGAEPLRPSRSEVQMELVTPRDPELPRAAFWAAGSAWSPYFYGTQSGITFSSATTQASAVQFVLGAELRASARVTLLAHTGRDQVKIGGTSVGLHWIRMEANYKLPLGPIENGWGLELRAGTFVRHYYQAPPTGTSLTSVYGGLGPTLGFALKKRLTERLSVRAEGEYRLPLMLIATPPGSSLSTDKLFANFSGRLGATYWFNDRWGVRGQVSYDSHAASYNLIPGVGLGPETTATGMVSILYGITARF